MDMNSSNGGGRHYPMLEPCRIVLHSRTGGTKPPVRLPQECLDAARADLPKLYDFSVGKEGIDVDGWSLEV